MPERAGLRDLLPLSASFLPEKHSVSHVAKRRLFVLAFDLKDVVDLHAVLLMRRRMGRLQVPLDQLIHRVGLLHGTQLTLEPFVVLIDGIESRVSGHL